MQEIEFALHQGPACAAAAVRKRWPDVQVSVEEAVAFGSGVLVEKLTMSGKMTGRALEDLRAQVENDSMQILEEGKGFARVRLATEHCPHLPLIVGGRFRPELPFRVEADSDRWLVEDEPERIAQAVVALKDAWVLPKMMLRDPRRRPAALVREARDNLAGPAAHKRPPRE